MAAYEAGIRVIAAFFGPYAPEALTLHGSVFSHDFKRFERLTDLATGSYDALCPSCRALPHAQQEPLLAAALARACRKKIEEDRGGDHAQAGIPASA